MKNSTQKLLFLFGLFFVQMVMIGTINESSSSISQDIPHVQTNPNELLTVYDHGNKTWTYISEINAESDEILQIYSNWSIKAINGTIQLKSINDGPLGSYDAISNDSSWINFSIPIKSHPTPENKIKFCITVKNSLGGSFTSDDQTYSTDGSNAPIYRSNTATYQSSIVTLPNSSKAIQFSWSGFDDENQILGYTIYRKSAIDGVAVNNDNRDSCVTFNSTIANFTDSSLVQDLSLTYYYGIIAFDRAYHTSQLFSLPKIFGLDDIAPSIVSIEYWVNSTSNKKIWNAGDSTTMDQPIFYPNGNITIHIISSEPLKEIKANLSSYTTYGLTFIATKSDKTEWEAFLNLSKPQLAEIQISPGVYYFSIIVYDRLENVQNLTLFTFMKILEPISTSTGNPNPIDLSVFFIGAGIIIGIAVIGGGFYMLNSKRKVQKVTKEALSEFEVSKGPSKSKKRGQVYSGASAEGRKSAAQAEIMQARRTKNPSISTTQVTSKSSIIGQNVPSISPSPDEITRTNTIGEVQPKEMKPTARDTEIDIDDILATNSKSGTATIKMKAAEANIDTVRRMEFLRSKLDALDQNMALMPVILEQTSTLKTLQRPCEICGHTNDQNWIKCPYCATNEIQNSSSQEPIGENVICPKCKKVIKTGWIKCPYCFVEHQ